MIPLSTSAALTTKCWNLKLFGGHARQGATKLELHEPGRVNWHNATIIILSIHAHMKLVRLSHASSKNLEHPLQSNGALWGWCLMLSAVFFDIRARSTRTALRRRKASYITFEPHLVLHLGGMNQKEDVPLLLKPFGFHSISNLYQNSTFTVISEPFAIHCHFWTWRIQWQMSNPQLGASLERLLALPSLVDCRLFTTFWLLLSRRLWIISSDALGSLHLKERCFDRFRQFLARKEVSF